jgi:hypothetical protein
MMAMKPKNQMGARVYAIIADVIAKVPDEHDRRQVGDHFATEFRKRFASFDPVMFERLCGGRVRGYDIRRGRFADGTVPPL